MIEISHVIIDSPVEDLPRGYRKIQKEAGRKIVKHWHEKDLPKHFRQGAEFKYGYAKRSARYLKRKERKLSSRGRPLVYTTLSLRQLTRFINIRGTAVRATGTMHAPSYFRKRSGGPDLRKELTTVLQTEAEAMAEIHRQMVHSDLLQPRRVVIPLNVAAA